MVSKQLLRLSFPHTFGHSTTPNDFATIVSHYSHVGDGVVDTLVAITAITSVSKQNVVPKLENTRSQSKCCTKAREYSKPINMAQVASPTSVTIFVAKYNDLLQLWATHPFVAPTIVMAPSGLAYQMND
ncbi:hypothetical protein CR513_00763, partial [Mucuna pruriens]